MQPTKRGAISSKVAGEEEVDTHIDTTEIQ